MQTIKYNWIIWNYYKADKTNISDILYIIASGCPTAKEIWKSKYAPIFNELWSDVVIPDYYWFWRSDWDFAPNNCVKTILKTYDIFSAWEEFLDLFLEKKFKAKYKKIVVLWRSFWWWIVAMLPKINPEIKNIAMCYPQLEFWDIWTYWIEEEDAEEFMRLIKNLFPYIYRWIDKNLWEWEKYFQDEEDYCPIKQINYLKNINLFLCHWTEDKVLAYKRTRKFYNNITKLNNKANIKYLEILWKWHWWKTFIEAIPEIIKFYKK
jgi:hypothetical protein